jgi:hypothetical protein
MVRSRLCPPDDLLKINNFTREELLGGSNFSVSRMLLHFRAGGFNLPLRIRQRSVTVATPATPLSWHISTNQQK